MSDPGKTSTDVDERRRDADGLFRSVLLASLALHLTAAGAVSLVKLPDGVRSQADAVPRTALVSYESQAPLPDAVTNRNADLLLSGAGPGRDGDGSDGAEGQPASAPSDETGGGGAEEGSGASGGGDAESAEKAFLSVFGSPGAEGTGGGGVAGDADVRSGGSAGASAPRVGSPRSGIGSEGGSGRPGRQPLSGGGSGVAGSLGPGEGDGGGIERTGRVEISDTEGSGASRASGTSGEVFERIGSRVRQNEAQIRFCYQEQGLKENPDLAGTVRIEFDVEGGRVLSAEIRSGLTGAGARTTEACILDAVRAWRFPDVDESVTVPFTFVLTR